MRHHSPTNRAHFDEAPLRARIADAVAAAVGSWTFVIVQTLVIGSWIAYNLVVHGNAFDPWPFIALNLLLSMEAAYTGPILQLSSNRQTGHDRLHAETSYAQVGEVLALVKDLRREIAELRAGQRPADGSSSSPEA
jgi:uncharacterized membrane protein